MTSRKNTNGKQRKGNAATHSSATPDDVAPKKLNSLLPFELPKMDVASMQRRQRKDEKEETKTLQMMLSNLSLDGHQREDKKIMNEFVFNSALMNMQLSEEVTATPPPKEECPLCMYSMPPNTNQSKYMPCCGQVICRACDVRNNLVASPSALSSGSALLNFMPGRFEEMCAKMKCAFCRSKDILPVYGVAREKHRERLETRANKEDSRALMELGYLYLNGDKSSIENIIFVPRNAPKALECFKKAASLDNCDAHYELARLHKLKYEPGNYLACLEKAAELGSMKAHVTLAEIATQMGNMKVSMDHHKVLAAIGYSQDSIDQLTSGYRGGHITKDELASSLRAYQAAREDFVNSDRTQLSLFASGIGPDGNIIPSRSFM